MKKKILFLAAIVAAMAAMPSYSQVKLGLRIGANISNTDFSEIREIEELRDVSIKNNAGFLIGPMLDVKIPILGFGVDLGLQYSYKRYEIEYARTTSVNSKQHMFEIPLNLKYNIDLGQFLGLYVAAGPSFGFNLNPKGLWNDIKECIGDDLSGYAYNRESFEVALNLGAGIKILSTLHIGFNYNIGLSDAAKGSVSNFANEAWNAAWNGNSFKSRTWQIHVAVLF